MTPSIPDAPALPALPIRFDRNSLAAAGFTGWQTWAELRSSDCRQVPHAPAVYVVYRDTNDAPDFLHVNPGGRFKGKDPTVTRGELISSLVPDAHVVYIGKADIADRRFKQFSRFGAGEPVGHWGGRLIWQLADSAHSASPGTRSPGPRTPAPTKNGSSPTSPPATAGSAHSRISPGETTGGGGGPLEPPAVDLALSHRQRLPRTIAFGHAPEHIA